MGALMRAVGLVLLVAALAGCATQRPTATPDPHFKIGKPYKVNGKWYHPQAEPDYDKVGVASWYGQKFHGRRTANGEIFDKNELTAAHTTLPLPSLVEVENLENGRTAVLRVNDRGPFAKDRIIDLSRASARRLGFESKGLAKVRVRYAGPAPLPGAGRGRARPLPAAKPATTPTPISATIIESSPEADIADLISKLEGTPPLTSGAEKAALVAKALAAPSVKEDPGAASLSPPESETEADLDPESAAATAPQPLFLIRIAALKSLENIDKLRAALSEVGPLRVAHTESADGNTFYRINMGPYANRTEAAKRLEAVREAGYKDAALVTISP